MIHIRIIIVWCILILFMVVFVFHEVFSHNEGPTYIKFNKAMPNFAHLLSLTALLFVIYLVEAIFTVYNVTTPSGAFMVIFGFLFGTAIFYNSDMLLASELQNLYGLEVSYIYVPVIVFNVAFSMDSAIFLKTLPQIVVIGLLVFVISAAIFGGITFVIVGAKISDLAPLVIGIFTAPMSASGSVQVLREQSRTKFLCVLLEGESLIIFLITELASSLLSSGINKFLIYWYHYILVSVRAIILGPLIGVVFGYIARCLIRRLTTDPISLFLVCFAAPFITYIYTDMYGGGVGSFSVVVVGLMLSAERSMLPKEVDTFLVHFWHVAALVMESFVCLQVATLASLEVVPTMEWEAYPFIIAIYLLFYMVRFVSFLLFSPVLSRLGYGLNFRDLIVLVWGCIKSPYSLLIVVIYLQNDTRPDISHPFTLYLVGNYLISVILNGSTLAFLLKVLGLNKIPMAKQINMSNSLKRIFEKRNKCILLLKLDKFLSDSNWPVVLEYTNIKHPYQIGINADDDSNIKGYRYTWCSDCKKEIPQEPTSKEIIEMSKEAKLRILKANKMSYSRQHENGMISKKGVKVMNQSIEWAMDSKELEFNIEHLKSIFFGENCFTRCIRNRVQKLAENDPRRKHKPPRTYWRRICYNTVIRNRTFAKVLMGIVSAHLIVIAVEMYYHPALFFHERSTRANRNTEIILVSFHVVFVLIYWIEIFIKVLAYSAKSFWSDGCVTYFKSFWNITDFLLVLGLTYGVTYHCHQIHSMRRVEQIQFYSVEHKIVDIIKLLRAFRILRLFEVFYPDILNCLESKDDSKKTFTYELGKCYINAESEVLGMLPYMIDNLKIRQEMREKIEANSVQVSQMLTSIQKEKVWIAITVKTTQSIRTILNNMLTALNELKAAGWVDTFEYESLTVTLHELHKKVNNITKVLPSPPKVIFKEVTWMAEDEAIIDFLFENVTTKTFLPGEIVLEEGMLSEGIYIVVTGLFQLTYSPNEHVLENLQDYGLIPIVDYVKTITYDEKCLEFVVTGNCIGELGTLTERPYNCTIRADAHSQVYCLSKGVLKRAMELSPDPVLGLECRIWKEVALRTASSVLLNSATYQSYSQDEIKFVLERSFVPNLSRYKIFTVTEIIEDIVLIEGIVADYNTTESYVAPCYIPRTVQKLVLPKSSIMNLALDIETKLLIIPTKDVDEYDVMMIAEENCEMIHTGSMTKCLQHTVQGRNRNRRRNRDLKIPESKSRISGIPSSYSQSIKQSESKSETSEKRFTRYNRSQSESLSSSSREEVIHGYEDEHTMEAQEPKGKRRHFLH